MTAPGRRAAAAAVAGFLLIPTAYASGPPVARAAGTLMPPGETLVVSGTRPLPTIDDPAATAPAVSDDGTVVAYAAQPLDDMGHILVRDTLTGTTTADIGNDVGDFANPSLSADGAEVAFTATSRGFQFPGPQSDVDVYVADLGETRPVVRRVTGTPSDLRYQRYEGCSPAVEIDLEGADIPRSADRCGPQLSGDGRSVVIPAQLSVVSPKIRLSVPDDGGETEVGYGLRQVGVLDFTIFGSLVGIDVRVNPPSAVHIDGAEVTAGSAAFDVVSDSPRFPRPCVDVTVQPSRPGVANLRPDQECTVAVQMTASTTTCRTELGTLRIDSPTPRGRTELALAGESFGCIGVVGRRPPSARTVSDQPIASAAAKALGCVAPAPPSLPPPQPDFGNPVDDSAGEVRVGASTFVTQTVTNFSTASDLMVHFVDPDCGATFAASGPGIADPCFEGMMLSANTGPDSCTAIVALAPTRVGPISATLTLLPCGAPSGGTCAPTGGTPDATPASRAFRFAAAGTKPVAVLRRDADDDGDFTGSADPPAVQVSVDSSGRLVDGETPVLSNDGRYVAFASTDDGRRPGPQIFVHDTDRRGDGTFKSGRTVVASRSGAGPAGLPESAIQPSLSGDGTRVAYVTRDVSGRNPEGIQVRVHDLATGAVVLASSAAGTATPADKISYSPSLSRDGSTVAFASRSTDLVTGGLEICCAAIFVRDLGPDFGGPGLNRTDPVSLHSDADTVDDWSGLPALDADGGLTVFQSADALLPGIDLGGLDQVYARARFPDVAVEPSSLTFGGSVNTTSGLQTVTVTNTGMGPAAVQGASVPDSFTLADACGQTTLHRGESCRIGVRFAPSQAGRQVGALDVTTSDLVEGAQADSVRLTGTAVERVLRLRPASIAFPKTPLGIRSDPVIVTASNVSGLTISVGAAIVPDDGEFAVRTEPAVGCTAVAPGHSCRLVVTFRPLQRGSRDATMQVIADLDGATVATDVPIAAAVTRPTFEFSPTVAQEGRVAFVIGTHLMPRTPLTLTWDRGPIATPDVVTRADGSFSIPAVILTGAGAGQRTLTVTMRGVAGKVTGPTLLVVTGTAQPPDFVSRN